MSIFERMQKLTQGKVESEQPKPKVGDTIQGTITNIIRTTDKKKGGYGFITSTDLPFERIFFHWRGLRQDTLRFPELRKRMKVEFELKYDDDDGYKAIKIKVLGV